ncbi:hypothetical protein [Tenacibaculum ovolyticum]|uniref:hypothetical protein n=1 Tax=Tenacibaculum ovolyticum TaxID=104270 RepID=UPI003BA91FEE
MTKTANYFISGAWKDNSDNITHLLLHTVNEDNSFQHGIKTTELSAINLLKQRNMIKTITLGNILIGKLEPL